MTTRVFISCAGALALLVVAACGSDLAKKSSDAGSDSGAGKGDAGLTWKPDASGLGTGSGDAGADASVRMCAQAREPLPSIVLPRCTAVTRDCVAACSGAKAGDCRDACVKADKHPASAGGLNCSACVYLQLFACADQNGCHASTADTFCCIADKCPAGSASNCTDTMCNNQVTAAITCTYSAAPDCLDFTKNLIAECFASADDAGTADAGQ